MTLGLVGLAIGSRLHVVEEGVRVDCDRRVRVVPRHVCEQMDDGVHKDNFTQSFHRHFFTRQILAFSEVRM